MKIRKIAVFRLSNSTSVFILLNIKYLTSHFLIDYNFVTKGDKSSLFCFMICSSSLHRVRNFPNSISSLAQSLLSLPVCNFVVILIRSYPYFYILVVWHLLASFVCEYHYLLFTNLFFRQGPPAFFLFRSPVFLHLL